MRLLGVGLANTSSGSFLVTKAHVTHLEMKRAIHPPVLERVPGKIATPDWSLLDKHAPLSEFTRSALESRCKALERNLLLAQQWLKAQEMIMEGQNAQLVIQNIGMERMNHTLHEKEKGKKSDRTILFPGGKGRHLTDVELIKQKQELEDTKAQEEAEKERKRVAKEDQRVEKANLEERWKAMLEEYEHTVKDLPKKPKHPTKPKLMEPEDDDEGQDDVDDNGS
ncbi:hypothetical protein BU17DRAFT_74883 [Hysterangium stoloniferum]|nr:hypothetical protein BU17DRAFT_74883 [Hysterangium stoloniferum]